MTYAETSKTTERIDYVYQSIIAEQQIISGTNKNGFPELYTLGTAMQDAIDFFGLNLQDVANNYLAIKKSSRRAALVYLIDIAKEYIYQNNNITPSLDPSGDVIPCMLMCKDAPSLHSLAISYGNVILPGGEINDVYCMQILPQRFDNEILYSSWTQQTELQDVLGCVDMEMAHLFGSTFNTLVMEYIMYYNRWCYRYVPYIL